MTARLLLADAEERRGKRIEEGLAARGYVVERAATGPEALEGALGAPPDALVLALDLPLIEGTRLAEILRANPRTRGLGIVFLVEDELDIPLPLGLRDRAVVAPWDAGQVAVQVDGLLGRTPVEPAKAPPAPVEVPEPGKTGAAGRATTDSLTPPRGASVASDLEGEVSQLPLADLLQLLQQHRRSGSVRLSPPSDPDDGPRALAADAFGFQAGSGEPALIRLLDGQVVEATAPTAGGGRVTGEKALFRLLDLPRGRFEFVPDGPEESDPDDTEPHIQRPLRALLVEAARQRDEWRRRRVALPSADAYLRLEVPRAEVPTASHPLTAAVLDVLEADGRVGEIVNRCPFPDYQVLCALHELMLSGAARLQLRLEHPGPEADAEAAAEGSLTAEQLRRLRAWMSQHRAGLGEGIKVAVVAPQPGAVAAFEAALRASPGFAPSAFVPPPAPAEDESAPGPAARPPDPQARTRRLGPLGRTPLGDGLWLVWVCVPTDGAYAPLWRVACDASLGSVLLLERPLEAGGAVAAPLLEAMGGWLRDRPRVVLVSGAAAEPLDAAERAELSGKGDSVLQLDEDPAAVLRELAQRLLP